jgi:hypothetical protein
VTELVGCDRRLARRRQQPGLREGFLEQVFDRQDAPPEHEQATRLDPRLIVAEAPDIAASWAKPFGLRFPNAVIDHTILGECPRPL